jgi:Cu-Zn family superoxide dismutase
MKTGPIVAAATALLLGACASAPPAKTRPVPAAISAAQAGSAILTASSASLVSGKVTLRVMGDGVHLTGTVGGFGAHSQHGIHVHEKGDCSAVDASSAGGHFNPTASAHGRAGSGAHHAGDMDNLLADGDGVARVDLHLRGVTLGGGARRLPEPARRQLRRARGLRRHHRRPLTDS